MAGERGSPDTWRDPRGFALKFYTTEGNFDMVGNNTPVFFMRDPMKFQHFIRSQKRMAANNLRDHHMQWDFWTLSPESAHQVTWLMGDRGIPKTWRHMNGYSSHTYSWLNADGELFWVKYHFKTDQGIDFLTQEDADRLAGEDGDYHQRDLYTSIEDGNFPSWTLHVQIMPFEDAKTYRFNPFDLTKVWPHGDYPLHEVGKMTLNRNVTDYHAEIEQAAFEPNNIVPGTGLSPDKMLLARGFSYSDAHRARLGVNYKQIPVNEPKVEVHTYSKDGAMRIRNATDPVYAPNSMGGPRGATRSVRPRCTGRPTATWSAPPTRCAPRTTTGASPARWSARCSTTTRGTDWPTTSSATCPTVCGSRCCRGCSSTGRTSTPISARRSRRACAPTSTATASSSPTRGRPCRSPTGASCRLRAGWHDQAHEHRSRIHRRINRNRGRPRRPREVRRRQDRPGHPATRRRWAAAARAPTPSCCSRPATPPASSVRCAWWRATRRSISTTPPAITAQVGFGKDSEGGFGINANLIGYLPGLEQSAADELMQKAHGVCPYSKATRGNIDVTLSAKV